jgi:chemotaxis protein histidine kinase CheA
MASKLDDIFNECYERMRSGESLESCLRSYPQYRAQLEPLLRTTFDIGRRVSYIQPRPEFKHWARVRLESAQRYPRQQTRAEAPAASTWLRHGWAVAVSAGIVLLLTTGSTMAASSQALPDQPLYPVKLATEQVRVALAVSDAQKAQVETDLANIRAAELEAMANADKTEEAAKAAERYNDQFEKALLAITKSAGTEPQPPVYVPPTVSTPPATATPPAVSTPPTVTTPPETTTPTETTVPPVTTTPTENATPTATTTAPAITTPPVTTTPTETTVPPVTTTPTENATPTATTTAPAVTTPTETTTPSTSTTHDESKATKTDRLRKSLDKSTSKSITALQDAKEKASEKDKHDWQKSIDTMKKSQKKSQDTTSQSDNVTGNQQGHDSTKSTNGYHPNR